eukprot:14413288-Alexandrium_andersonii.AAC.1
MQEDGAQGDVLLQHAVVHEEEEPLLVLEGGGVEQRGVTKHLLGDHASARAEDVVLNGVEGVSASAQHAGVGLLEAACRRASVPEHRE